MEWQDTHHWAAMALQAVEQAPNVRGWTVRIAAVLPGAILRGGPGKAAQTTERLLSAMRQGPAETFLRWDDDVTFVHVAGAGVDGLPVAVLALGGAHAQTPAALLLGVEVRAPVLGLVAVQRGYLRTVSVTRQDGTAATERVWAPAGGRFPEEDPQAQPALAAFAIDRRTGQSAVLAHRVRSRTAPLTAHEESVTVDLEAHGRTLGALSLLDHPLFALRCATGAPIGIEDELQVMMPAPGWVVGRWWLHAVWQDLLVALEQAGGKRAVDKFLTGRLTADPRKLASAFEVAVRYLPEPPRDLAGSWAAIAHDQLDEGRLGPLVSPAEAQWLPRELLAATCVANSPAQNWLWEQLETLLTYAGSTGTLERLRTTWAAWPELHEPETFFGSGASLRR